jgi:hypothetical protein
VWSKNGFISSGPNGLNPLVLIGENRQGRYLVFLSLFVLTLLVCWTQMFGWYMFHNISWCLNI